MVEQTTFGAPLGSIWNPKEADPTGYTQPDRSKPALHSLPEKVPTITVMGTIRNERLALSRSLSVWLRQQKPDWLTVEYLICDDGSCDGIERVMENLLEAGAPIRYTKWRLPGDEVERSCTVVFNAALRLVRSPLVLAQWYDRVPGSLAHLVALVAPHRRTKGIVTSATSRHIGSSSSVNDMAPQQLAALLALVDWKAKPEQLSLVAGPIGGHCVAGQATESSGLCIAKDELVALGGWDERYAQSRHGYPNVDLWRRVLGAGLVAQFPAEPVGANYHLSHPAGRREGKDTSLLSDVSLVRNPDGWSIRGPIYDSGPVDPRRKMGDKALSILDSELTSG